MELVLAEFVQGMGASQEMSIGWGFHEHTVVGWRRVVALVRILSMEPQEVGVFRRPVEPFQRGIEEIPRLGNVLGLKLVPMILVAMVRRVGREVV
jgi:hypothetical protein